MRTTVNIDNDLLAEAKRIAVRTRRPLGEVVDDALRLLVAAEAERPASTVTLPTFGGSGLRPGVDLEDPEALAAVLDGDDARAAG
jgi:Arc/MetJ family transcription regulator